MSHSGLHYFPDTGEHVTYADLVTRIGHVQARELILKQRMKPIAPLDEYSPLNMAAPVFSPVKVRGNKAQQAKALRAAKKLVLSALYLVTGVF
jgi:hypothetical protein